MSIRAVGWLGSKLGLDIGGRGADDDGSGRTDSFAKEELAGFGSTENRSSSADPVANAAGNSAGDEGTLASVASQWEAKLGRVWRLTSEKATQFWNTNVRSGGGGDRNAPFGLGSGRTQGGNGGGCEGSNGAAGDNPELDENGLPVTKNWYYFDANLGRWTVSADAPQSVQREYYEQLEETEKERLGQKTVVAPPPPPPPPPPQSMNGAGAYPPPPGSKAAPSGVFGAGGFRSGHGPQYAMPDYFGATVQTQTATAPQPYPSTYSPPQQNHLTAVPFPQPSTSGGVNRSASASGYASNSPYSGTPGSAPIRTPTYPPGSLLPPHDQQRPLQTQPSPPPLPPSQLTAAGPLPMKPAGYAAAPYPPTVAALSPPQAAPLPIRAPLTSAPAPASRASPSPSGSSLHASYSAPSHIPDVYRASMHQSSVLASPPGANNGLLQQPLSADQSYTLPPQQLYTPYPPPQGNSSNNNSAYGSGSPYGTNFVPTHAPATPPVQTANNHPTAAAASGQFNNHSSQPTQSSLAGSPYGSARPPPPVPLTTALTAPAATALSASTEYHYGPTPTTTTTQPHSAANPETPGGASAGSGGVAEMQSATPSAWQLQPPASMTSNPFAPAAPTQTLPPSQRPQHAPPQQPLPLPGSNSMSSVNVASAAASASASVSGTTAPTAAQLPPSSFRPFSPS